MSINEIVLNQALAIRLGSFTLVLALMAAWEAWSPMRTRRFSRRRRWPHNFALMALNAALLRLLFPIAGVGFAALALERGWGLFNTVALPFWLEFVLSAMALDLVIYLQHITFHAVPLLWRIHRVHHADPDFDVSTGTRFHPAEILLSMLIKLTAIALIGPPVVAVLLFEIMLNATAMFNHANLRLPPSVDGAIRRLLVTPGMHRIHHSTRWFEANSNFGFNLSLWDRLFGTYQANSWAPQETMPIGAPGRDGDVPIIGLWEMLALPFRYSNHGPQDSGGRHCRNQAGPRTARTPDAMRKKDIGT